MKTTLDINDPLLADAKTLAAPQRGKHRLPVFKGRRWLERAAAAAASGSTLILMPMVIASVLRLVSSPKIFRQPTPVEDAVAFVDALLAAQAVHFAPLGPEWPRLRQLCIESSSREMPCWMRGSPQRRSISVST